MPGHRAGRVLAAHLAQGAGARDRQHHHAGRRRLARAAVEGQPERVAQDQLLEANAGPKRSARAHSPPIERAATSITHTAVAVEPQLGVDRALAQPERAAAAAGEPPRPRRSASSGRRDGVT